MKAVHRFGVLLAPAASAVLGLVTPVIAFAQPASAPSGAGAAVQAAPDLAARVADLEAYVTNSAPKALISSGPGHNAWMMTSAALVLSGKPGSRF
jgi:ammonium transporter, Amt family